MAYYAASLHRSDIVSRLKYNLHVYYCYIASLNISILIISLNFHITDFLY